MPTPERLLVFRILTAAAMVDVIATPSSNALPGVGAVKSTSYAAIVALGVTVIVWSALTPHLGLVALAVGMLVNSVIKGGVPILAARRLLHMRLTPTPSIAAALALLAGAGLMVLTWWPRPIIVAALYLLAATPVLWQPGKAMMQEMVRRLANKKLRSAKR